MSHKEIDTLRQKLYYIDTSVNTFFNRTLINIQKSLNDLNIRVTELEKTINQDSNTNSIDVKTKKTEKKQQSNLNKTSNSNLPNQIRTISLQ